MLHYFIVTLIASNLTICVILYRLQRKATERIQEEFGATMFLIYAYHLFVNAHSTLIL